MAQQRLLAIGLPNLGRGRVTLHTEYLVKGPDGHRWCHGHSGSSLDGWHQGRGGGGGRGRGGAMAVSQHSASSGGRKTGTRLRVEVIADCKRVHEKCKACCFHTYLPCR
eukprot:scaffold24999_cov63-Phaeocystis_antarctica.AAC.13